MKDYTTKTVYLGIDVHKTTYSVTAICEGRPIKKATVPADPERLVLFCRKFFPDALIYSAYEAGFAGFSLHRVLEKNGIKNIVIHPAGLEVASGNRVKTDKKDSLKIALHLSTHRLRGINVPSKELEEKRAVTRIRDCIVERRVSIGNQIKSFLHHHGIYHLVAKQKVCPKWIKSLKELPLSEGLRFALDQLVDMWQQCHAQVQQCLVQLKKQAAGDGYLETIYRSAPGIGPIGARVLANELEDMGRFTNERQLFSYLGLTPSEHSSGEYIRKGHISRQGKPILRKYLILAAWKAIKMDKELQKTYERLAARAGGKRAIVAVARRLAGHIRACFQKQYLYWQKDTNAPVEAALQIA